VRLRQELQQLAASSGTIGKGAGGVTFFEVDHPASQRVKRARLRAVTAGDAVASEAVAATRFVAHDFQADGPGKESLEAKLAKMGFDSFAPSVLIMEGLLMYLTPPAVDVTFALASRLCAPGSSVCFTFIRKPEPPDPARGRQGRTAWRLARDIGAHLFWLPWYAAFQLWLRFWAREPWTFWGWDSAGELRQFIARHGFALSWQGSYIARARAAARVPEGVVMPKRRMYTEQCAVCTRV
jgi:methyltransferase (TIGR00027 family)